MDRKKAIDVLGTILLFAGFFLAFLPHTAHLSVGLKDQSHLEHVIGGSALVVISLAVLIYNNKALRKDRLRFFDR